MHCDLYGRPRENPSSDNGIWYAMGAALVVFVGAGILTARSAIASPAPDPNHPVTPPTPRPPGPRTTAPTFVRQAATIVPTSHAAVRVLQQQLKDLGYHVTSIDGDFGPETTAAAASFIAHQGLSAETTDLELMIAVDTQYAYFFDPRGGLRSV